MKRETIVQMITDSMQDIENKIIDIQDMPDVLADEIYTQLTNEEEKEKKYNLMDLIGKNVQITQIQTGNKHNTYDLIRGKIESIDNNVIVISHAELFTRAHEGTIKYDESTLVFVFMNNILRMSEIGNKIK